MIVGVEAEQLLPSRIVGVDFNGEIETAAVTAIRHLVDPVPDFEVGSVVLPDGKVCLAIRVHPGSDPPYVMNDGAILVRTPANSEPISAKDRLSIDRLFSRGHRGEGWARQERDRLIGNSLGSARNPDWFRVCTVPCADRGIALTGKIFKKKFVDEVSGLQLTPFFQSPPYYGTKTLPTEVVVSQTLSYDVSLSVNNQGILTSLFQNGKSAQGGSRQPLVLSDVEAMLPRSCALHARVLEELLGYRGRAVLGVVGGLYVTGENRLLDVRIEREPFPIQRWSERSFHDDLVRSVKRHIVSAVLDED